MHRRLRLPAPLETLAELVEGEVRGPGGMGIAAVRSLDEAGPEDLSFVLRSGFLGRAVESQAGAFLIGRQLAEREERLGDRPAILVEDAEMALVTLLDALASPRRPAAGVHPTAVVDDTAAIDPTVSVGPYAVVGPEARLGPRVRIGSHAVVGAECELAEDVVLHPHVVLYDRTIVGAGSVVHAGTVLGADGFGYVSRGLRHHKIAHIGRTRIDEDVEIGALSAVDRGQTGETVIGAGTRIDNMVQVGHNARTGRGCILCGQVGVSGSARLGNGVVLGGQVGVADHVDLVDGVMVAGMSGALRSLDEPGPHAGIPAVPMATWRRTTALLPRLQELWKRVGGLERRDRAEREENDE